VCWLVVMFVTLKVVFVMLEWWLKINSDGTVSIVTFAGKSASKVFGYCVKKKKGFWLFSNEDSTKCTKGNWNLITKN
jgi:hypothetical protein